MISASPFPPPGTPRTRELGQGYLPYAERDAAKRVLSERELTHGPFVTKAVFIQKLKESIRASPSSSKLTPAQLEALDMIASKMGRILYGDPAHDDHWTDIAGYAHLANGKP